MSVQSATRTKIVCDTTGAPKTGKKSLFWSVIVEVNICTRNLHSDWLYVTAQRVASPKNNSVILCLACGVLAPEFNPNHAYRRSTNNCETIWNRACCTINRPVYRLCTTINSQITKESKKRKFHLSTIDGI